MTETEIRRLEVKTVRDLGPGLREFGLSPMDGPLAYEAGQWLSFQVAKGSQGDKGLWRVYSFCSAPSETASKVPSEFRILVETQHEGQGGSHLRNLRPGDEMRCHGPYGAFTLRERASHAVIFIADGVGIGPVRSLVRSLLDSRPGSLPITLVHEAAVPHALVFRSEFEAWAQQDEQFQYISTVPGGDSDWHGETRDLNELVPSLFQDPAARRKASWYLCGSGRYTDPLRSWLGGQQVEADRICVERFFD